MEELLDSGDHSTELDLAGFNFNSCVSEMETDRKKCTRKHTQQKTHISTRAMK